MHIRISRREFLKLAALGTVVTAGLVGSKRAIEEDFVNDFPMAKQAIATTCLGCSAGCGILLEKYAGKILRVSNNPDHPRNPGVTCARMRRGLEQLYSTRRIPGALYKTSRSSGQFKHFGWKGAIRILQEVFDTYKPAEIAFLLGTRPDHLYDLLHMISSQLGGFDVLRFSLQEEWAGRVTLMDAAQLVFGMRAMPYFDVQRAQVIFSFGAEFREPWLVADIGADSTLIHFGTHLPAESPKVDQYFPVSPCNAIPLIKVLSHLVAAQTSHPPESLLSEADLIAETESCEIGLEELQRLAALFAGAAHKVALPGASLLNSSSGLAAAQAILGLNVLADEHTFGESLFFSPNLPVPESDKTHRSTIAEVDALLTRLRSGQVKVLLVHGVDLLSQLPTAYSAEKAFEMAERIISFSPLMDATSYKADNIFPDHTALESWGYQRVTTGSDRPALSAIQPVITPRLDTCATSDLLLKALNGTKVSLNFDDEVDFIQSKIAPLINQGGTYSAKDMRSFWVSWLQTGGWWKSARTLLPAVALGSARKTRLAVTSTPSLQKPEDGLQLVITSLDEKDSTLGKSMGYVFIHARTASQMGLRPGKSIRVSSSAGSLELLLRITISVMPGIAALNWRDARKLIGRQQNVAGTLVSSGIPVRLTPLK